MTETASRRAILTGAVSLFALAACGPREAAAASASEKAFADSPFRTLTVAGRQGMFDLLEKSAEFVRPVAGRVSDRERAEV